MVLEGGIADALDGAFEISCRGDVSSSTDEGEEGGDAELGDEEGEGDDGGEEEEWEKC